MGENGPRDENFFTFTLSHTHVCGPGYKLYECALWALKKDPKACPNGITPCVTSKLAGKFSGIDLLYLYIYIYIYI